MKETKLTKQHDLMQGYINLIKVLDRLSTKIDILIVLNDK